MELLWSRVHPELWWKRFSVILLPSQFSSREPIFWNI